MQENMILDYDQNPAQEFLVEMADNSSVLLDNGAMLTPCGDGTGCYRSSSILADGSYAVPHFYEPLRPDEYGYPTAFCLVSDEEHENMLLSAEMSGEQNYNMLDGIVNNMPDTPVVADWMADEKRELLDENVDSLFDGLRINQGYIIQVSEPVGDIEIVLGVKTSAPEPFAIWRCSFDADGEPHYATGSYFVTREAAEQHFRARVQEEREQKPSLLAQLRQFKMSAAKKQPPKEAER